MEPVYIWDKEKKFEEWWRPDFIKRTDSGKCKECVEKIKCLTENYKVCRIVWPKHKWYKQEDREL